MDLLNCRLLSFAVELDSLPETDLIIPKGVGVWINVMAIHFDENHYANPHDFDPDHFSKDAKAKRNP